MPAIATDSVPPQNIIFLADPTIIHYNNTYYLYGTGGKGNADSGFFVYTSPDMHTWRGPAGAVNGYALAKGNVLRKLRLLDTLGIAL